MSNIFIHTGEIKSGKTTRLQKWIEDNPDSDGILSPIINGKRYITRIKSRNSKLLDYDGKGDNVNLTTIGNKCFFSSSFEWGRKELYNAYLQKPNWLIIDEIGPLELKGEALEPIVNEILQDCISSNINIILVIRKSLLDVVIEHYKLNINGYNYLKI